MRCVILITGLSLIHSHWAVAQEIVGTSVTPHQYSSEMRWRRAPDPELSAKTELFIRNTGPEDLFLSSQRPPLFDGRSASEQLEDGTWSWHDTPESWLEETTAWPTESLTVFKINGKSAGWGVETQHQLKWGSRTSRFTIESPQRWISSVTFRSVESQQFPADALKPNRILVHLSNRSEDDFHVRSMSIWLPDPESSHHVFRKARDFKTLSTFASDGLLQGRSRSGFSIDCEPLPLTYAVLEVLLESDSGDQQRLWAHVRVKTEVFDISGGWVASDINGRNSLTIDAYLQTLQRMHINTGQIQEVSGYTDLPERYGRHPLKRFNRLQPIERYDTDLLLPTIHAVEFLGEPQYGGGTPVAPQKVWTELAPYQSSRLPTSLTLSEERTWRYYAGLSDYPHFDAYRVTAPAADSWQDYERWGDKQIRWGAPLETIGVMTRSLRELSRPRPIAYWSQGAHHGWGNFWNPRRSSPTPDELRAQAWQGLANRITSLYWFNLSLKSLVKFPDLIEPITRVNREIRMLDELFLDGDAFEHRRDNSGWDLDSIATSQSLLMVANDLNYRPDSRKREFVFQARDAELKFTRPHWMKGSLFVFRVDADGTHDVPYSTTTDSITIRSRIRVAGIFVATTNAASRQQIAATHRRLVSKEEATGFDPAGDSNDRERLRQLMVR